MRGFVGLVALALAHVARSEVFVSDFAALQNATANGAVIRIMSSFDWTGQIVISGVTVTITNAEGRPVLTRRGKGNFFEIRGSGTLIMSGVQLTGVRHPRRRAPPRGRAAARTR